MWSYESVERIAQPDELAGQRHHANPGRSFRGGSGLSVQQRPPPSPICLCSIGLIDVLWATARDGIICQPVDMEQPGSLLDFDSDFGELGGQCDFAAVRGVTSGLGGDALRRIVRANDSWRSLGQEPGRRDVLIWPLGIA